MKKRLTAMGKKAEAFVDNMSPIVFFIACFTLMAIVFAPLIMWAFSPALYETPETNSSDQQCTTSSDASSQGNTNAIGTISASTSEALSNANNEIISKLENEAILEALTPLESVYAYDVSHHTTEELITKIDELDYKDFPYDELSDGYRPDVTPESDDPYSIAKQYLDFCNNGECSGCTINYMGLDLGIGGSGTLIVNGEPTTLKSNRGILTDIAKELYFRGVWDAPEKTFGKHTFGVSQSSGALLVDGSLAESQLPIDRPDNWSEIASSDYAYVPEKGLYGIVNQRLVKFLRGEIVYLPGGKLTFSGIDFSKEQICNIHLRYTEYSDNFFLFVNTCPIGIEVDDCTYTDLFYDDPEKLNEYFYAIPDPDVSRLKFYAKLSNFYWFGSSSSTEGILSEEIRYCDSYGRWYLLTENGFIRSTNPYPENER